MSTRQKVDLRHKVDPQCLTAFGTAKRRACLVAIAVAHGASNGVWRRQTPLDAPCVCVPRRRRRCLTAFGLTSLTSVTSLSSLTSLTSPTSLSSLTSPTSLTTSLTSLTSLEGEGASNSNVSNEVDIMTFLCTGSTLCRVNLLSGRHCVGLTFCLSTGLLAS
jgi:hypothetical protein